jgi:hypothetical protein
MRRNNIYIVIIHFLAGILQCTTNIAGGGSDLPDKNVVVGSIFSTDQIPAANTQVMIIPADYNMINGSSILAELIDTTDSAGIFIVKGCPPGDYNIEAIHISKRTRLLVTAVKIGSDTTRVPADTLRIPGSVKFPISGDISQITSHIYIPGTTIAADVAAGTGYVVLDSVPAGKIPQVCFLSANDTVPWATRNNLIVFSGDTVVVAKLAWKFSHQLRLNTASSGANVRGSVFNVPILIRLNSDNFDFSQADIGGADIRFTKCDTLLLPHEIEHWDPIQKQAEIWVKIDTVHGNDSTQSITMYWGNSHVKTESKPSAVFDTTNEFEGVWHLNEVSGSRVADATGNGYSGSYIGGLPRSENSSIGICQKITRPDSEYVSLGNVLNPGFKNISMSIWIKSGSTMRPQALIGKTNGEHPSASYGYLLSINPNSFPHFYMTTSGTNWGDDGTFDLVSNQAISDTTTWHYITVVIDRSDNKKCRIYVDGVDWTGSSAGNITTVTNVNNDLRFCIGSENDNNCSYKGSLAEVSLSFTLRSADWVKLCYMNQKEQDVLLKW